MFLVNFKGNFPVTSGALLLQPPLTGYHLWLSFMYLSSTWVLTCLLTSLLIIGFLPFYSVLAPCFLYLRLREG